MGYYINVTKAAVYVKEADFFREQGGLKEEWGKTWQYVDADGIEHARLIGKVMAFKQGLTSTIGHFSWYLGELEIKLTLSKEPIDYCMIKDAYGNTYLRMYAEAVGSVWYKATAEGWTVRVIGAQELEEAYQAATEAV
jgi:hypothetical protein